jgi:hypothetical protein
MAALLGRFVKKLAFFHGKTHPGRRVDALSIVRQTEPGRWTPVRQALFQRIEWEAGQEVWWSFILKER